jgi:hypothetical protein
VRLVALQNPTITRHQLDTIIGTCRLLQHILGGDLECHHLGAILLSPLFHWLVWGSLPLQLYLHTLWYHQQAMRVQRNLGDPPTSYSIESGGLRFVGAGIPKPGDGLATMANSTDFIHLEYNCMYLCGGRILLLDDHQASHSRPTAACEVLWCRLVEAFWVPIEASCLANTDECG